MKGWVLICVCLQSCSRAKAEPGVAEKSKGQAASQGHRGRARSPLPPLAILNAKERENSSFKPGLKLTMKIHLPHWKSQARFYLVA